MGWNDHIDDPDAYESHVSQMLARGDELRKERVLDEQGDKRPMKQRKHADDGNA